MEAVTGEMLNKREISALLARRDLIIRRIDEMIRERGEPAVLY